MKCIINPRKLVMEVAKFSASFCYQKCQVGTYNGKYFSVKYLRWKVRSHSLIHLSTVHGHLCNLV